MKKVVLCFVVSFILVFGGLYYSFNKVPMTSKSEVKVSGEKKPSPVKDLRLVQPPQPPTKAKQAPNWWERSMGYIVPIAIVGVLVVFVVLWLLLSGENKFKIILSMILVPVIVTVAWAGYRLPKSPPDDWFYIGGLGIGITFLAHKWRKRLEKKGGEK